MKKTVAFLLVFVMVFTLSPVAFASNKTATEAADILYDLGLFQGTGTNEDGTPIYSLENACTRQQGIAMLLRLLGKEAEVLKAKGSYEHPFTDVDAWAEPYISYAYAKGLTDGVSADRFGNSDMTATQYITIVLRALGYSSETDFSWDAAWELSDKLKITSGEYSSDNNESFLRADAVLISLAALSAKLNGSDTDLITSLVDSEAVSKEKAVASGLYEEPTPVVSGPVGPGPVDPTPDPSPEPTPEVTGTVKVTFYKEDDFLMLKLSEIQKTIPEATSFSSVYEQKFDFVTGIVSGAHFRKLVCGSRYPFGSPDIKSGAAPGSNFYDGGGQGIIVYAGDYKVCAFYDGSACEVGEDSVTLTFKLCDYDLQNLVDETKLKVEATNEKAEEYEGAASVDGYYIAIDPEKLPSDSGIAYFTCVQSVNNLENIDLFTSWGIAGGCFEEWSLTNELNKEHWSINNRQIWVDLLLGEQFETAHVFIAYYDSDCNFVGYTILTADGTTPSMTPEVTGTVDVTFDIVDGFMEVSKKDFNDKISQAKSYSTCLIQNDFIGALIGGDHFKKLVGGIDTQTSSYIAGIDKESIIEGYYYILVYSSDYKVCAFYDGGDVTVTEDSITLTFKLCDYDFQERAEKEKAEFEAAIVGVEEYPDALYADDEYFYVSEENMPAGAAYYVRNISMNSGSAVPPKFLIEMGLVEGYYRGKSLASSIIKEYYSIEKPISYSFDTDIHDYYMHYFVAFYDIDCNLVGYTVFTASPE